MVIGFLALTHLGGAQTYHPFPIDSAFWKYYGRDLAGVFENYSSVELEGDTVLGGKTYARLFETNQNTITVIDSTIFYPRHFIGGLREEDRIVYFYNPDSSEEHTAFNFNLGVGDTVAYVYHPLLGYYYVTISAIDSVQLLDETFRRRFNFLPPFADYYIEGIGSSYGILPEYTPPSGLGSVSYQLTYFKDHGEPLYHESATEECSVMTSVLEVPETNKINIRPNPFSNYFTIEFGKTFYEGVIEIRNLAGQIVFKQSIGNSSTETISNEYFKEGGIYFLIIKTDYEVYSSKLVYQR
ncbi:MAG: T9SS type A sorting domain-containing protein [Chitinophagales bacterium]